MYPISKPEEFNIVKKIICSIHGALWFLDQIENSKSEQIFVDNLNDIKTVVMITNSSEYFFAGVFNEDFLIAALHKIQSEYVIKSEDKVGFFYSTSEEWKNHIKTIMEPYKDQKYGNFLIRRFYQLNLMLFQLSKEKLVDLEPGYQLVLNEGDSFSATITYQNKDIAFCKDNGQALGIMDLDVYVDPNHRRKGLAQICVSQVIDYCIEKHILPQWGCWNVNVASCNLAQKLGFELIAEEEVVFANYENIL